MHSASIPQIDWQKFLPAISTSAFARKLDRTKEIICQFIEQIGVPGCCAGFSGGKDSTALIALISSENCGVPVFTQLDDLDWPEKEAHCKLIAHLLQLKDYEVVVSARSAKAEFRRAVAEQRETKELHGVFREAIASYVTRRHIQGTFLGLRAAESPARRKNIQKRSPIYQRRKTGAWICLPLAYWTAPEILGFLVKNGLPLFHVYHRLGAYLRPENVRMSWPVFPNQIPKGAWEYLHLCYPEMWRRLCQSGT